MILPFRTLELLQNPGNSKLVGTQMPSVHPFSRPRATRACRPMVSWTSLSSWIVSGVEGTLPQHTYDLILWLQRR